MDTLSGLAEQQVSRVLDDQTGQWILQNHRDAHCEFELAGAWPGMHQATHVVLDRLFVSDGVRWIVDYKTSCPDEGVDPERFVAEQISRHTPQLKRYAQVFSAINGCPIRTALYLTALPKLVEVELAG